MSKFTVTLNYNCNYGYVEYDEDSKTAVVTIDHAEAKALVEKFLSAPVTLDVPVGEGIRNFETRVLDPLASIDNFKTCMTRLWVHTQVRVEWSMPPGMAEKL